MRSASTVEKANLGFLRADVPPDSVDDVRVFLELRKKAYGYDEKDRQYKLKWCDGSMSKYVQKMWDEEENKKLIRTVSMENVAKTSEERRGSSSSLDLETN
mmetsp:Transcript_2821/g.5573  ORF Transcript_2821/g.5573 Transcript_2821/m.5573 type:complete len:101 (+) Transcript_2821:185-487(+)|eukprot:CAMPEP_0114307154 /NCGR_PEP_ID=MMETSP0059-20121206/17318_1 /TAXON_ID=36894 /ORGANISM="Pyramimonas parkeae, Strain CCMP726" /LENGTH=100 /DNA_ID=CAMNT_0001430599 /DNA_START=374 /DNA_END=676 /DNA_ORIENTATION=+